MQWRFHTARFSAMSSEAKVAVALFFIVGVLGTAFGLRGVLFFIKRPALLQLSSATGKAFTLREQETQEREAQKKRDTDADGLSDYDELYVFKTSAYLADTDSDGVDDAQELRLGKDPVCPEGRLCVGAIASAEEAGTPQPALVGGSSGFTLDFGVLQEEGGMGKLLPQIESASPKELRAYLLSTGIDPTIVNKLTDEQVRKLFTGALEDVKKSGALDQISKNLSDRAAQTSTSADQTTQP